MWYFSAIKNPLGTRLSGFIMFIENGTNGDRTCDRTHIMLNLCGIQKIRVALCVAYITFIDLLNGIIIRETTFLSPFIIIRFTIFYNPKAIFKVCVYLLVYSHAGHGSLLGHTLSSSCNDTTSSETSAFSTLSN